MCIDLRVVRHPNGKCRQTDGFFGTATGTTPTTVPKTEYHQDGRLLPVPGCRSLTELRVVWKLQPAVHLRQRQLRKVDKTRESTLHLSDRSRQHERTEGRLHRKEKLAPIVEPP